MKPVGLRDPRTGHRPWAVLQLRMENAQGSILNLVGFQTNLKFGEQKRVFGLIPALHHAEFLRYGVMHRNTFIDAPRLLASDLSLREHPRVSIAGQLSGTEGYLEAAASGLVAALGIVFRRRCDEGRLPQIPRETALGALLDYATDPATSPYQPMHVNFGLLPPADPPIRHKKPRYGHFSARGKRALDEWRAATPCLDIDEVRVRFARMQVGD
jgi:methylenetetrahydrofolate--tRNA-(uracil-5-)-methyltransferase